MKAHAKYLIAAIGLLGMAGCQNGNIIHGPLYASVKKATGWGAEAPARQAEASQAGGIPLIVGIDQMRVAIPFSGEANGSKTYAAPDGVTLTMTDGFLTRATGMGANLNALYLPGDSPWFDGLVKAAKSKASTERIFEYWKNRDIQRDTYTCTLSRRDREGGGSIIDESCEPIFGPGGFENRYWMDDSGQIECSRQWIHPRLSPVQVFKTTEQAVSLDLTKNGC